MLAILLYLRCRVSIVRSLHHYTATIYHLSYLYSGKRMMPSTNKDSHHRMWKRHITYRTQATGPRARSSYEKTYHVTQNKRTQQIPKFSSQTKLWPNIMLIVVITKPVSSLEYKYVRHPWDSISCQSAGPQLSASWGDTRQSAQLVF